MQAVKFAAACLLFIFSALPLDATSFTIDPALFGHVDQADVTGCTSDTGINNACGPTAITNSLVYLQNAFPSVYGSNLIPHQPGNTAYQDQVAGADSLICYITCSGNAGGTAIADFISGKQSYFDTNAPNTTVIETMMIFGPNGMWPTL